MPTIKNSKGLQRIQLFEEHKQVSELCDPTGIDSNG